MIAPQNGDWTFLLLSGLVYFAEFFVAAGIYTLISCFFLGIKRAFVLSFILSIAISTFIQKPSLDYLFLNFFYSEWGMMVTSQALGIGVAINGLSITSRFKKSINNNTKNLIRIYLYSTLALTSIWIINYFLIIV